MIPKPGESGYRGIVFFLCVATTNSISNAYTRRFLKHVATANSTSNAVYSSISLP